MPMKCSIELPKRLGKLGEWETYLQNILTKNIPMKTDMLESEDLILTRKKKTIIEVIKDTTIRIWKNTNDLGMKKKKGWDTEEQEML